GGSWLLLVVVVGGRVEVALEGVEAVGPQPPVGREPRVDLGERRGAQHVEAPLRVLADLDEPALAQDAQVLGDAGLAQAEQRDELADRARALEQEVEDAPARRLGEHLEGRGHAVNITLRVYTCQDIYDGLHRTASFPSRTPAARRYRTYAERVPARARRTLRPA